MLPIVQLVVDGRLVQGIEQPRILAGNVIVPFDDLRYVAQRVWYRADDRSITVQRGDRQIVLFVGSRYAWVNGNPGTVRLSPLRIAGQLYVPLAVCAQALGGRVDYHGAGKTVSVLLPPLALTRFTPPPVPFVVPTPFPSAAAPAPASAPTPTPSPMASARTDITPRPEPRRTPLMVTPSWP
ncbi:copper amine oxidase N-terminal domain-containing protein [bacterium]|nr:MAG: copper amine oxidase N-terminal domain-containing protein [bacterium]